MPSESRDLDLEAQLQSFAVTLESNTREPIRPGQRQPRADAGGRSLNPLNPTPPPSDGRRWFLPAVAAAAVLVVVAGLVALSGDDTPSDAPSDAPAPPPSVDSLPEPTIEPKTSVAPEPTAVSTVSTSTVSVSNDETSQETAELAPPESGETQQQTIIGDIAWTLIEGDSSTQPPTVTQRIDGVFFGVEDDGSKTWESPDGITWELSDRSPNGVVGVFDFDGEKWARTSSADGQGLSRWDGTVFVPVELPKSLAPDVAGLADAGGFPGNPGEFGDGLVIPITRRLSIPWTELFSRQVFAEWDAVTETIRIVDPGSNDPLPFAVLTTEIVEGQTSRVEFRDAETGELVTSVEVIPGVDPDDFLTRLVTAGGFSYNELLIGDGDGFEAIEAPWRLADSARVATLEGRVLSVVQNLRFDDEGFGTPEWELWTSVDARTWTPLELPASFGAQIDNIDIVSDGSLALLTIVSSDESVQRPETWSTVDGSSWEPAAVDGGFGGTEVTEFGWFRSQVFDGGGLSVSPDGLEWQEIPIDLGQPAGAGGGGASVFGRTIFVSMYEQGGARTMWVGRVAND
jgi:hypothetical protein